jgi:dienelactone hydrolase
MKAAGGGPRQLEDSMNKAGAAMLAVATGLWASGAAAAIPASLYTAGDRGQGCTPTAVPTIEGQPDRQYLFCDDGVPQHAGGTTPNEGGVQAVTVPAEYGGDGYTGLPPRKLPTAVGGADGNGDIALDVDISWPLSPPPAAGYPILFFMHGCCGGNKTSWESATLDPANERWHYNNAWFATRGYVVVTYTARGFGATPGSPAHPLRRGSTGETQIDSRRYEINDYQSLACQIYAGRNQWASLLGRADVPINPEAVVVTGGSYGGGFAWMALTDPVWTCNAESGAAGTRMKLAAVAPRYGWTDLVYSLVPTGRQSALPGRLPDPRGCDSGSVDYEGQVCAGPVGVPKQTINAGLYGTGTLGTGPNSGGATFPESIHQAQACLTAAYPPDSNPACASVLAATLQEFLADRSAYYQQHWFDRIVADPEYRIPVFSAATLTDPLFPPHEHRRMHNRILSLVPGYPLQAYFGDFQHFTQNKAREWGDICFSDADGDGESERHVCTNADFAGNDNAAPASLVRQGITTRLNRFIDHYARPGGNPAQGPPAFNVTAALQVCPQKGADADADAEPGDTFVADTFEGLARGRLVLDTQDNTLSVGATGARTSHTAGGGLHADPVLTNQTAAQNPHRQCPTRLAGDPAPPGVAQYQSAPLERDVTLLGTGTVAVTFTSNGTTARQLHARLYEVLPDGSAVLADRGFRRLADDEAGALSFELFGNGWRFAKGNRIRLELAQDDAPYLKASTVPSSLTLSRVVLTLSTRTAAAGGGPVPPGATGGSALALSVLAVLLAALGLRRASRRR